MSFTESYIDPMFKRMAGLVGGFDTDKKPKPPAVPRKGKLHKFRVPSSTVPNTEAGPCPYCPSGHQGRTRVYAVKGKGQNITKCCCDRCGSEWSLATDHVPDLAAFCARLADELAHVPTIENDIGQRLVVISHDDVETIVSTLRELMNAKPRPR